MQTNQTMTVTIGHNVFSIDHKTMMGNLNQFWDCGNAYRIEKGLPAKHLEHWVRSPEVADYVAVLEREFKSLIITHYNFRRSCDSVLDTRPADRNILTLLILCLTRPWNIATRI